MQQSSRALHAVTEAHAVNAICFLSLLTSAADRGFIQHFKEHG
jgi:hypothetical protein